MDISQYLSNREGTINSCPFLTSVDFYSEIIDSNYGYFKAHLKFYDGSYLFLFEIVFITLRKPHIEKYRYHYQDSRKKLIFRWDNAPHHPEVKSFPHHLHIGNKVKASFQPALQEVFRQVIEKIEKQK